MIQPDLFETSTEARDRGIALVTEHSEPWQVRAMQWLRLYPHAEATGEQIANWVSQYVGEPHHPNAYGALVMVALRRGYIRKTGEWRKMEKRSSHARQTPVYEIL